MLAIATSIALMIASASLTDAGDFVNFESGHVRPLAFVASADLLLAVNTPDNRLAVFEASGAGLARAAEVPVGLEPVAVAARILAGGIVEAWVVNHLSDSISVVEIDPGNPSTARVTRTVLIGDEPRDILFAGSGGDRVFVTTAHRGQNRPGDAQLLVPGTPRADVWVFDADDPGGGLSVAPLAIVEGFGDTPRALAASQDGSTVYAAVFRSGSGTTTLNERTVSMHGGLPPPPAGATAGAPLTGLIVEHDSVTGEWTDELGRDWSTYVPFGLPDYDVFVIDADAAVPAVVQNIARVGTTILKLAVRPLDGKLYVANTQARNAVRFEPVLRGHLAENRITVVDGATLTSAHLNSHVDYGVVPGPPAEVEQSLAIPIDMVFSPDGTRLYVAAFGSGKIAVLDPDQLEVGSAFPREDLDVGGGPSGLALDVARDRLYVMNRFDDRIAIVADASQPSRAVSDTVALGFDPSPAEVNDGRRFLYDARATSAHGDESCASCHLFGDMDDLAWDLGDPFGAVLTINNPTIDLGSIPGPGPVTYHPMKGPMLTQSLRGLRDAGPMHWRGDRSGATDGGSSDDAAASFTTFKVAFPGLLGRATELDPADMAAFTAFVLTLRYPPNPIRPLDGPSALQTFGEDTFLHSPSDGGAPCVSCHALPLGTPGLVGVGFPFFQAIKVPHLRNAYQKVGRFGLVADNDHDSTPYIVGDQIRGFGLEFNGSLASVFDFHGPQFGLTPAERNAVTDFVLAFDTGLDAAVGQQVTATPASFAAPDVIDRISLLTSRAEAGACDLVVKGSAASGQRGWVYGGAGTFRSDRQAEGLLDGTALRLQASTPGEERTFTCAPPGSGARIGIDRDADGIGDSDETDGGSDPADPASVPATLERALIRTTSLSLKDRGEPHPLPKARKIKFKSLTKTDSPGHRIVPPTGGGAGDPRIHGATLDVFNAAGSGEVVTVALPPSHWRAVGSATEPKGYRFDDKASPISRVSVLPDKLQIKGGGETWRYTLDEPSQSAIAVRLRLGTGLITCASAPASPGKDTVNKFTAEKHAPAPAACPTP
jgi:DNA-binding beta-propeller fold protein YncE